MKNELNIRSIFAIGIIVWMCGVAQAQTFSMGGVVGANYELKILKGWHVSVEGDLRFDQWFTHYNRAKIGLETD